MKRFNLSHNAFSATPLMVSEMCTAHSGPELVSSVPQSQLASELAQALLTDHIQITQQYSTGHVTSSAASHVFIGLSRK